MTRLNEQQQDILNRAKLEAERVAQLDAAAEERFRLQKEINRELLRGIASEAADASVPIRQFGLAIGTSDFKTIKGLYPQEGD